jgi:tRNA-Thr(GGU) m(6)t(6)A37 methyltransferase TsaA
MSMVKNQPEMIVKAIGTVRNDVTKVRHGGWEKIVSEIEFEPGLTEALDGLERFSHIIVMFWMSLLESRDIRLKIHPGGETSLPQVGLFATRTPRRPNPIGKTTVRLIERRGNVLKVMGLDAVSGTPVIDIKPYVPKHDCPTDAEVSD